MAPQSSSPPPYAVHMDPTQALELVQQGAILLILAVPQGTILGVDQAVFTVGPRFQGIKMLPPGAHFISYRATDSQGGVSPATGFFIFAQPRQVIVKRWDPQTETLVDLEEEEEQGRYEAAARQFEFDAGLAPYNLQAFSQWRDLSSFISQVAAAPLRATIISPIHHHQSTSSVSGPRHSRHLPPKRRIMSALPCPAGGNLHSGSSEWQH